MSPPGNYRFLKKGKNIMIDKYRKKPVVIEALQFTPFNMDECEKFVGGDFGKDEKGQTVIATLEGAMVCSVDDFIIKGINGEFYPCKPNIFYKTYEKVAE
jgi:hypothetical protein